MGKKGGKKGKIDSAVEKAEPNLATIPEEGHNEEKPQEEPRASQEAPKEPRTDERKSSANLKRASKSILKTRSSSKLEEPIGASKSKTVQDVEPLEKKKSVMMSKSLERSTAEIKGVASGGDMQEEGKGKKGKGKKGKKDKKSKTDKSEGTEDGGITTKPSSEKVKVEASSERIKDENGEKPGKKGKKGKKGKGSEVKKETKETQKDMSEDESSAEHEKEPKKTESRFRSQSRVSFSERTKEHRSRQSIASDEGKQTKASRASLMRDISSAKIHKSRSKTLGDSLMVVEGHRRSQKFFSSSRVSIDTDDSDEESEESLHLKKEDQGKKKKGKKQKGQYDDETDEEREKRIEEQKAAKEAKRAEKKAAKQAAKLAAKQAAAAAAAQKQAEKSEKEKGEVDIKKRIEELKKIAKEMGIEASKFADETEEGPKKKMSKKEKARVTSEMAEKARVEQEAQAKRLEELIRKKKEEERLAAIDKDRRETFEQGWRVEQLQVSCGLIRDVAETSLAALKKEKDELEWKKYVECGKLPNSSMCDQMNTYLHLWGLVLDATNMEAASDKTTDAIILLNELDELIVTSLNEDEEKLNNWKWVRQVFREYQAASLDVATYRLLRDVDRNLNRINIPTADFNFKDDYVTLCIWLRVMLPIPLPNPRRPPKPRIDVTFSIMDVNVLFPYSIDCENAAIRAMYLKYDHLSDLCDSYNMPEVPIDYYMNLLEISQKEWRAKALYKYKNRDRKPKPVPVQEAPVQQDGDSSPENMDNAEQKPEEVPGPDKKIEPDEPESFASDEEIPMVPFKQLVPNPNDYAVEIEDELYSKTREHLLINVPDDVINLRKFVILGGVYHLNLIAQPPQPQDFITMEMTITGLYLPKKLEVLPFKVVYTPYVPPERTSEPPPPPPDLPMLSTTSITRKSKMPEEIEDIIKKQEEELDKLILINIKWPQHVIFLELPIVCRWDEDNKQWSKEEIYDLRHNEEKFILSFRTGVFGIYGLATYKYVNLPFQAYDIKPEIDGSVTVQLTAAILMLEFNLKDGFIAITQLQNSPNMTLQNLVGKYIKLHQLIKIMKEAGIDIFPAFDAFCYVDGCCEKQWATEKHLYCCMAQMASSFNFSWSRWNLQAGRRKIVLQMRQYMPEKGKQKNHQMVLVTPLKSTFIECTEISQVFSEKEVENIKFCADLYNLMKFSSGIFVRNKIMKASKQNVYTLGMFLISLRIMSFS